MQSASSRASEGDQEPVRSPQRKLRSSIRSSSLLVRLTEAPSVILHPTSTDHTSSAVAQASIFWVFLATFDLRGLLS